MEHKQRKAPPLPRLYLISSGEEHAHNGTLLLNQLNLLPRSLSCMVQIREKQLNAKELLELALQARAMELPEGTLLLMNERADIALAAGFDGVHLPENGCSAKVLRSFAPELLYGCSIHSASALCIAEESGADYLLFGPVFDTPSKRIYGAPQGLKKLGELCGATSLPVFALGGITLQNAASCMAEGAYGVAGLSIFQDTAKFAETFDQFYLQVNR
ncbi:MAG: thiamine phosphate synthase [Chlorobiaceae bacterium]